MLGILSKIDRGLAQKVSANIGVAVPKKTGQLNFSVPADADPKSYDSVIVKSSLERSAALSMADTPKDSIATRKIAFLIADGVSAQSVAAAKKAIEAAGAVVELIAPKLGAVKTDGKQTLNPDKRLANAASVLYDAVFVPGGGKSIAALCNEADAIHFLNEAFKHCKAIGADADAQTLLDRTYFADKVGQDPGLIAGGKNNVRLFINATAQHRFWEREKPRMVPA